MRRNTRSLASLLLVATVASSGCEDPSRTASPATSSEPAGKAPATPEGASAASALAGTVESYTVAPVENPGALRVVVTYSGDPLPQQSEVTVNINMDVCGGKVFTQDLIVDPTSRGLKNVVVRLEGITSGKEPPERITITNKDCAFVPHVGVAVKGTKIELLNDDPVLHTTHPFIDGVSFFNKPLNKGDTPQARPIPRTGVMSVLCDIHKWMQAYVIVHSNPYLAASDAEGQLTIDEIPPGEYPYVAWHEKLGEKKGTVEIEAGQVAELKLVFDPPVE